MRNIHDYSSILDKPYKKSTRHKHMSNQERGAQFSPFAALTGHSELVDESGRYVDEKREIVDDRQYLLDMKIMMAQSHPDQQYKVNYFQKDSTKQGGEYLDIVGTISKIKENKIYMNDQIIPIEDIYDIEEA